MNSRPLRTGLLVIILAVAAWFRFSHLDLTRFNFDRAFPVYQAETILRGALPWNSLNTSLTLVNPAGWSYALVPLVRLPDPVTAVLACSSALSLLAVLLVYDLGRRLLGAPAGLVAAAALAINPWAQYYGRGPWVQGPFAFGAVLIAWLLWPALLGRATRPGARLALSLVALGFVTQTYLVAYALLLQVGLALALFPRRVAPASAGPPRFAPLLAGCAALVLLNLPFAAGLWQMRAETLAGLRDGLTQGEPAFTTRGVEHMFRLVTGQDYDLTWTAEAPDYSSRRVASQATAALLTLGMFAGCARAARALWRPGDPAERDFARLAVGWLIVPLALFAYTGRPVHAFYLSSTYPASLLLLGWGVAPLLTRRVGQVAVTAALAACGAIFALDVNAHYVYDDGHPISAHLEELPWRHARLVGERLRAALEQADYVVRTPADDSWLAAITGQDVRGDQRFNERGWWTFSSTHPALFLLQSQAADGPEAFPSGLNDRRSALTFANGYIQFIALDAVAPQGPASDIGWQACGIEVQILGDRLRVQSTWSVSDLPAERGGWYYGPFYHLVDGAGDELLAFGDHGAGAKTWRVGDVYVDVAEIELPPDLLPGIYRLEYGLWDPNRDVRARFDVAGQSLDLLAISLTLNK